MMGPNSVDEIDCDNLFDQIDDLIEFPTESECGGGGDLICPSDGKDFQTWNDALSDSDLILSGGGRVDSASDLFAELSVPYEDIVQLEWLSNFVEDSFSGQGLTMAKDMSSASQFQTSSPVSVLESSSATSSTSGDKTLPPLSPNHNHGLQRARTKRPRPPTLNPWPAIQLLSPSSSSAGTTPHSPFVGPHGFSSESDNFAESPRVIKQIRKVPSGEKCKKNKRIKITLPVMNNPMVTPGDDDTIRPVRKCLHCEITKTPQWRAGPMGPKTLCNACGVRHKSGRLFPEYRPAASPTFIPSLHSNSHKKVVEMRSKVGPGNTATTQNTGEDLEVVLNT